MRIAIAIGALVLGVLAPAGSAERASSCGSIAALGTRYTVRIERGNPSCAMARKVLRAFIVTGKPPRGLGTPPRGWTCFRGHSGNAWAAACSGGRYAIIRAYLRG